MDSELEQSLRAIENLYWALFIFFIFVIDVYLFVQLMR